MANITVKNIPDDVYARIKQAAKAQHRSVNSYLVEMMASRAASARSPLEVLAEMREFRERIGRLPESLGESLREIRDGRDFE